MARIGVVPRTAICTAQAAAAYIEAGDYFNAANMGELMLRQIQTLVEASDAVRKAKAPADVIPDSRLPGPVIKQAEISGSHKTGRLNAALSKKEIDKALGGKVKTTDDDGDKVLWYWGFTVDGVECAIWDYKGARWSTYGPAEKFKQLFGQLYNDGPY
jgi:hypothetical protein